MVRGLDLFRERMKPHEGSIVLIGGAACDDWFSRQSLQFRATQDLDIVLIVELLDAGAVNTLRRFISDGQYETRARSNGKPELYRFADPKDERFPKELELFSRGPENIDLTPGETLPVITDQDYHSLSAILLDDRYYELIRVHHDTRDGLHFANATSLIPLKAFAWLDLNRRKAEGEKIDSQKIKKHRADVFRLAATLPAAPGPELPEEIRKDLGRFLQAFPPGSPDWQGILAAVKDTVGVNLTSRACVCPSPSIALTADDLDSLQSNIRYERRTTQPRPDQHSTGSPGSRGFARGQAKIRMQGLRRSVHTLGRRDSLLLGTETPSSQAMRRLQERTSRSRIHARIPERQVLRRSRSHANSNGPVEQRLN